MRHLLVYACFRLGMAVLGALPGPVARALGLSGGFLAYVVLGARRRIVRRHARRLGARGREIERMTRAIFVGYGRYWAEALWIRPHRVPGILDTMTTEGLEHVFRLQEQGRGMVLVLPHVGNWEFAGPVGSSIDLPLVAVAENLANRRIREWFVSLRTRLGIEIVLATGTAGTMRSLEAFVQGGGAVALLSDRDLRGRGVPVDFLGERTTIPAGPATLAYRTGAPIVPVAVYFAPHGRHRLVVSEPFEVAPGDDRAEVVAATSQMVADALGRLIAEDGAQWHMLQPNWPSDRGGGEG